MILDSIDQAIGNTPLLRIQPKTHCIPNVDLLVKLELLNPFGSLKDRIAKNMLDLDKAKGKTVIESSSGNTAKALAAICGRNDLPFEIVTNRIKQSEVRDILNILNAKITELPGVSECPDPDDPDNPYAIINQKMKNKPFNYFHTDQYFNYKNIAAHENAGKEILAEVIPNYIFGILGTCGSTTGIRNAIIEKNKSVKLIGVISKAGDIIPGGRSETELFEVGNYDPTIYDKIIPGDTQEAITGMLTLIRKEGIPCGPTTGLTFSVIQKYFKEHPATEKTTVVFLACDRMEPYISFVKKYRPEIFATEKKETLTVEDIQEVKDIAYDDIPKNTLLVDTRSTLAYSRSHIPGSINIQADFLEEMLLQGSIFEKETPVVLICPKGIVSRKHTALLLKQGYTAYSLKGGFLEYQKTHRNI